MKLNFGYKLLINGFLMIVLFSSILNFYKMSRVGKITRNEFEWSSKREIYETNLTTNLSVHSYLDIKEHGTFQSLDNEPYFYVRSSYLDQRYSPALVHILTVMGTHVYENTDKIRCHFKRNSSKEIETRNATFHFLRNAYCFFKSVVINCNASLSDPPELVSVSYKEAEPTFWMKPRIIHPIGQEPQNRKFLGVCVKTLFNLKDDSLPKIATYMEMQRILKVDQVVLYDIVNSSSSYDPLFTHYENQGLLKVVPWKLHIPSRSSEDARTRKKPITEPQDAPPTKGLHWCVFMHAQRLSIQECLLDNMDKFKYLSFLDVDEYIIPRTNKTLADVMPYLEEKAFHDNKGNVFLFNEAHFCPEMQTNVGVTFASLLRLDPIINAHHKSILSPKMVIEMGCHQPIKSFKGHVRGVPSSVAAVHHYRNNGFCNDTRSPAAAPYLYKVTKGNIVQDNTATRYFPEFAANLMNLSATLQANLPPTVIDNLTKIASYLQSKNSTRVD